MRRTITLYNPHKRIIPCISTLKCSDRDRECSLLYKKQTSPQAEKTTIPQKESWFFISCLQLEISCIYSVYSPFELILGNIKSSLIFLVLLHTLLCKSLCLFGTFNIYLVRPFKRLSQNRRLILCDLYNTRRHRTYTDSTVNAYLCLSYGSAAT